MISHRSRRRWLPVVGAIAMFALVVTGCGDDDSSTITTAAGASPTVSSPSGDDEPNAAELLAAGLEAIGERYGFGATVEIDGDTVTSVSGVVYDEVGSYEILTGGVSVEYIIAPDGQWARQEGDEWAAIAGPAPLAEPRQALMSPRAVTLVSSEGTDAELTALYSGSELGFADAGEVVVTITLADGTVTAISYEVPLDDRVARVTTRFDPTAQVEPIQVPPA